ncbi:glycosyltransferase family 39 protein [Fibrivirga algicola]|uniref:Phospholipid carrier-dependent glycosyltransferase n=1 Tax=Fibrivirga algicola TaxID=2950420 RepID=A0ABX0QNH8_9BACT|nr:glycosyltransferase family 39 protein [Fibrivirga algicola]NID12422.1 phospholipid carrier-dependent glycosyltransferase [Fibrivirga algicola]
MNFRQTGSDFASRNALLVLSLILLVAVGLRLYKLDAHGIFLDEKFTLVCTQGVVQEGSNQKDVFFTPGKTYFTPAEFWKPKTLSDYNEAIIRSDISNSPAYTGLLALWIEVFGIGDYAIRFLSVLFSLGVVLLTYLLAVRYTGSERVGLFSAALAATEPFFVAYAHVARSYSMTILVSLLSTYLFLLILERRSAGKHPWGLYIGYGVTYAFTILGHSLGATVFVAHGLYLLFYVRDIKTYVALGTTWLIATATLLVPWFTIGGGRYIFMTMAYQAQFYRNLAYTNPTGNSFGYMLPGTLPNVLKMALPVFADLFWLTNGLTLDALGRRNTIMGLVAGLLALAIVWRYRRAVVAPVWVPAAVCLLLGGVMLVATIKTGQQVVLAAVPLFGYVLYEAINYYRQPDQRRFVVLMAMLLITPLLFLLLMALKNDHTYGITQRYTSFSFPYALILLGMLLDQLFRMPRFLLGALGAIVLIQGYYILSLNKRILDDQAPKYTQFGNPRVKNPYMTAAASIKQQYAVGDTVLYPAIRLQPADEIEKTYWPFSIKDAQMTNLYLPRDATYYQRMDTTQQDRIWLVKGKTGERVLIFDFKGQTYRY